MLLVGLVRRLSHSRHEGIRFDSQSHDRELNCARLKLNLDKRAFPAWFLNFNEL